MIASWTYGSLKNWYKGCLHLHTTRSDGYLSLEQLTQRYADAGYDFICVTDHWVPLAENGGSKANGPILLRGIEIDGNDRQGAYFHVVAVGINGSRYTDRDLETAMDQARKDGAFLVWAHPHWTGNSLSDGLRHRFNGIEIYNHTSHCEIGKGYALNYWDQVLEQQAGMWGLAVDDAHFLPGAPFWKGGWVMVNAPECTESALLAALHQGHFYATQGPLFHDLCLENGKIHLKTTPVSHLRIIGPKSKGKWRYAPQGMTSTAFDLPENWPYVRLEIEDSAGKRAWTNPLTADNRFAAGS